MKLDNREGLLMQRHRSQSMVEFSLSLVALAMLVSGLLDLGRLYFIYTAMEDIVGEGVLYLTINPQCGTSLSTAGSTSCANPDNVLFRMSKAGSGILRFDTVALATSADINALVVDTIPGSMTADTFRIRLCFPDRIDGFDGVFTPNAADCRAGTMELTAGAGYTVSTTETMYVEMHYGYKLLTPFMPAIAGINPLRLSVAATAYSLVED